MNRFSKNLRCAKTQQRRQPTPSADYFNLIFHDSREERCKPEKYPVDNCCAVLPF